MEGGLSAHCVCIIFGLMTHLAVVRPQRAAESFRESEETRPDKDRRTDF